MLAVHLHQSWGPPSTSPLRWLPVMTVPRLKPYAGSCYPKIPATIMDSHAVPDGNWRSPQPSYPGMQVCLRDDGMGWSYRVKVECRFSLFSLFHAQTKLFVPLTAVVGAPMAADRSTSGCW